MSGKSKVYLGTNTKMYKGIRDTADFVSELQELTKEISREDMELFVIPSFTAIQAASEAADPKLLKIGAQNMGWEECGQFTGEISPLMLQEAGASLVMAGHSERRHILGETDEQENKKVKCALEHNFTALLCIGETETEKAYGISDEVLRKQLKIGLKGIDPQQTKKLWIAYEPVWAIGVNGKPASKEYAMEKHRVIKETLAKLFGREAGMRIPVLYGGSVNLQNAEELIKCAGIDGLFIGRSAWDAKNFYEIIKKVLSVSKADSE